MKYYDGIDVQVGDAITVEREQGENVAAVIVEIIYPKTEESKNWNLPEGGVMMEGGGLGTFFCNSLEKDGEIKFVHRAKK